MNLTTFYQIFPENNEDIINLKKQILKDFSPFIERFPEDFLNDKYSVNNIIDITRKSIEFVLGQNQQNLMQIINRVDIDEKTIKKIFLDNDFIENLLYEILKKECSKIIWRKKFIGIKKNL